MPKNKVQTNDHGVNVLVEIEGGTSMHMSHLDFQVKNLEVISTEELLKMYDTLPEDDRIKAVKNFLKHKEGYAVSNVSNKIVNYNDIVTYSRM